jgi:hypothetical protein
VECCTLGWFVLYSFGLSVCISSYTLSKNNATVEAELGLTSPAHLPFSAYLPTKITRDNFSE